jgi:hypothetical protein
MILTPNSTEVWILQKTSLIDANSQWNWRFTDIQTSWVMLPWKFYNMTVTNSDQRCVDRLVGGLIWTFESNTFVSCNFGTLTFEFISLDSFFNWFCFMKLFFWFHDCFESVHLWTFEILDLGSNPIAVIQILFFYRFCSVWETRVEFKFSSINFHLISL